MIIFFLFSSISSSPLNIEFNGLFGSFLNENKLLELRIFYEIPHNQLMYIKTRSNFMARFQLSCILSQGEKEIGDTWWLEDSLSTYEATLKKSLIKGKVNMSAPCGKYDFKLEIKDLNSQRRGEKKGSVVLKDIRVSGFPQSISSLVFTEGSLFFEVYNFSDSLFELTCKIGELEKSIKFDNLEFVNPVEIELPIDSLFGTQIIQVMIGDFEFQDTIHIKEPFWAKGYEKRVKQLYYIAEPWEIDSLLKVSLSNLSERKKRWQEFWEKRDPSPRTERNEFEEEYFKRVNYANEHFSGPHGGWLTDRGMVYIKLGSPDEIKSYPFEVDHFPYEEWYYYSKELKFIFVDEHGFGDYKLVYPRYWQGKFQL